MTMRNIRKNPSEEPGQRRVGIVDSGGAHRLEIRKSDPLNWGDFMPADIVKASSDIGTRNNWEMGETG